MRNAGHLMETKEAIIRRVEQVTHDTLLFRLEKPEGMTYEPGQAVLLSLDRDEWREQRRPFTFTSLDEDPELELIIKTYTDHHGMTEQLLSAEPGDKFLLGPVIGAMRYKGPGWFIAGGSGITPFIAMFRDLYRRNELEGNRLIFSNRTERDIILRDELESMLGDGCVFTVTDAAAEGLENRMVDRSFVEEYVDDFSQSFYVCGPPPMTRAVTQILKDLGASPDELVFA
jgi:ferredoxin-NADP reductase